MGFLLLTETFIQPVSPYGDVSKGTGAVEEDHSFTASRKLCGNCMHRMTVGLGCLSLVGDYGASELDENYAVGLLQPVPTAMNVFGGTEIRAVILGYDFLLGRVGPRAFLRFADEAAIALVFDSSGRLSVEAGCTSTFCIKEPNNSLRAVTL